MQINEKRVIEVIGRMIARAHTHLEAAKQTTDEIKAAGHKLAASDLMFMADNLADATDDPAYAKSDRAYRWASETYFYFK